MPSTFNKAADAAALSQRCAASLRANGALMACLLRELPKEKHDLLQGLLAGGGSVGIETSVDKHADLRVRLVAIEREGRRTVLAEVNQVITTGVH
jgi:precorrin-6B methylase 2